MLLVSELNVMMLILQHGKGLWKDSNISPYNENALLNMKW